jgi:hypothetical protein
MKKMTSEPWWEAVYKTRNPNIVVFEQRDRYFNSKFFLGKVSPQEDSYIILPLDSLLIPNKKKVVLNATLQKIREMRSFCKPNPNKDEQLIPTHLYGSVSDAIEATEYYPNGDIFVDLSTFQEHEVERRQIGKYRGEMFKPIDLKFTIRKTEDGAKVSVQYETNDK